MARDDEEEGCCVKWALYLFTGVIGIVVVAVLYIVVSQLVSDFKPTDTKYTVTITSVDGLDLALDLHGDRQVLRPVFGITVRIDNTHNKGMERCLGGVDTSTVVLYSGALLGKGTVPGFCVQTSAVGEAATQAWGMNVEVPHFLRDRLAGELERGQAVVDVVVRTPGGEGCYMDRCVDKVLVCNAKIGGGPSEC